MKAYQIRLIGTFAVTSPDGADALPSSRKARGLLAYLLLSGFESVTRERLASLFWSDRSEEQARASLRQTIYDMRSLSTGDQPLLRLDRGEIRIDRDRVATDLVDFRACARAGHASSLAALIGDRPRDLLEGLDGADAAFDAWLATERVRHRDERRQAGMEVAARALALGDATGAQRLAACLLSADPVDEAAARLAMAAHHAQGDRDAIRRTHSRLMEALQRDLGVAPSNETAALHQHLMASPCPAPAPQGGARVPPIPPGHDRVAGPPSDRVPEGEARSHAEMHVSSAPSASFVPSVPASPIGGLLAKGKAHRRSTMAMAMAMAMAATLTVIALTLYIALWGRGPDAAARRRLLLVQPLAVAPDDADALALRESLSTELARILVGNDATLLVADPGAPASRAAESVAPRDRFTVVGDAQNHAGMLRVNIKLLSARDDAILWSSSFDRPANEMAALREQIASKLADVTICAIGGRNPTLDDLGPETLRLYLGACENKHDDWSESARLLAQVVQRKPGFAHAWAMLAAGTATAALQRSSEEAALYQQALVYAQHALALDAREGEAYYARAATLPAIGQWSERMAILQAGHAAEPGNSPVNEMIAWNLAMVGRWQEAIAYAQQAEASDPFSPGAASTLAQLQGYGNLPFEASSMLQRARTRFPTIGFAIRNEFLIAANAGDPRHALALLDEKSHPLHLPPEREALWRSVLDARVDPSAARIDDAVRAVLQSSGKTAQGGLPVVEKLVLLNRLDQAYAFAGSADIAATDAPDTTILFHSNMAPFRADPRFMTVALRFGLVPIWQRTGRWPDFCAEPALPYDCRVEAQRALSVQARAG